MTQNKSASTRTKRRQSVAGNEFSATEKRFLTCPKKAERCLFKQASTPNHLTCIGGRMATRNNITPFQLSLWLSYSISRTPKRNFIAFDGFPFEIGSPPKWKVEQAFNYLKIREDVSRFDLMEDGVFYETSVLFGHFVQI